MINFLLDSLDISTCNYCAVKEMESILLRKGYEKLSMGSEWNLKPGAGYFVTKNSSAIFAFRVGHGVADAAGFRIIAAHSDSPGFKLKPHPEIYGENGVVFLNVEKYGGGILYTWFDRPLSLSGRLLLKGDSPFEPREVVFDLREPLATIPHLAIHFNREVNSGNPISVQTDMKPVLGRFSPEKIDFYKSHGGVVYGILSEALNIPVEDIIGSEIWLYPVEKPSLVGANKEYFQSGRIDDLSMAFTGLQALVNADEKDRAPRHTRVLAIFDNEETGSATKQGAHSPILKNILERICGSVSPSRDLFLRSVHHSFLISADDAHAFHPNYAGKHDLTNHPFIGGGPVVKINANSKYMTDAHSASIFSTLCREAGVECQYFVNHGDVPGGSTLGNILTAQLDMPGVDMGCAIWAMHSACETAGVDDHIATEKVFRHFYK